MLFIWFFFIRPPADVNYHWISNLYYDDEMKHIGTEEFIEIFVYVYTSNARSFLLYTHHLFWGRFIIRNFIYEQNWENRKTIFFFICDHFLMLKLLIAIFRNHYFMGMGSLASVYYIYRLTYYTYSRKNRYSKNLLRLI